MWLFRSLTSSMVRQAQPLLRLLGVMVVVGVFTAWTWPLVPIATQLVGCVAIGLVIRRASQSRSQRW